MNLSPGTPRLDPRAYPRPTATTAAYEALKRMVLVCELGPGVELRENDLAKSLALSRTPVREALNRLVHDGLVEVRPRQGYRVTDVTLSGVHEVFELREALEPAIVALVAQRAPIEALEQLRDDVLAAPTDSLQNAVFVDHHLHTGLADLSGNRYMARTMRHLLAELQRVLFLSLSDGSVQLDLVGHHTTILDALVRADADQARQAVLEESQEMRRRVVEAIMAALPEVSLQPGAAAVPVVATTPTSRPTLRFS
ncbi:MAG: GntR family transcriptional regulator [Austwickia sp.]|nr:GntR family transcriptional regulator [Austwickia sp.]MBK8437741.1 GntR family transcriptional regulator [Austwickia sp.]MBK9100050.1 GntR family transcriptional regulator [Austwickia sp.]